MAIGFLLAAVLDETQRVAVDPELCKRVRFRKSTCQKCVDVCPDNAITLSPGPSINDNCSNCGLCQNTCPTEVFQNDLNMDQILLKQAESLLSENAKSGNETGLNIHCSQAEKQDRHSLPVRCLGNVSENFLLGAALAGCGEMNMTKGRCSDCRLKSGEALFMNSVKTSQAVVEDMALGKFSLRLNESQKDNNKSAQLTRRELFSKIAHREGDAGAAILSAQADGENSEGQFAVTNGTRLSPKREMLRKLIGPNRQGNVSANASRQAFPWKKMKVDEANCVACAICVNVCPTGALTKMIDGNQLVRHLNNSLCTNCYLCQEACPEKVISFEEDYAITDLIEDKAHVVARIDMTSCEICGEIMPAIRGKICMTCQKRQVSPMFMNV
jgi:ferredoxin